MVSHALSLTSQDLLKEEQILLFSPSNPTPVETMFLSNIDQAVTFPVETVFFYEVPSNMTLSDTTDVPDKVKKAVSEMLLRPYYFMAGRLNFNDETKRMELICNNAGVIFVNAKSRFSIKDLGNLSYPNPTFSNLIHRPGLYKSLAETAVFTIQMSDSAVGAVKNALTFEEVWPILQEGIDKLIHRLEHEGPVRSQIFTSEEYMRFYTCVYEVCYPNPLGPDSRKMYDQYAKSFTTTSLPRYYIPKARLPSLEGTSHLAFYKLVYGEINGQGTDAILSLIDREREGEQIDQTFVKEILDIYVVIGADSLKYYEKDFEEAMVNATAEIYSKKALDWISIMSYENYMAKVDECLKQEESRVSSYLRYRTKYKLQEVVKRKLLTVHASKLEEKKHLDEASA